MSEKTKDIKQQLNNVAEEIERSILSMSDDEINSEISVTGEDPVTSANEVRELIYTSIIRQKKEMFSTAEQNYKNRSKLLSDFEVEVSDVDQRSLLLNILAQNSGLQERLTVQFRDLSELSDDEISSILRDIKKLNLLKEHKDNE